MTKMHLEMERLCESIYESIYVNLSVYLCESK